jgi:trans-aconitate methyltransferase
MGAARGTDRQWIAWGERDPWFGVLSEDRFRGGADREAFLASGREHVARVLADCFALGLHPDPAGIALDFGCGVGRVTAPLADRFARTVGVDVSPAMLATAGAHVLADRIAAGTVELRVGTAGPGGDALRPDERFVLIHSALVLQHLVPRRGLAILRDLLGHLAPGGVAVIQAPWRARRPWRYRLNQVRAAHPVLFAASRLLLGQWRALGEPVMQMKVYRPAAIHRAVEEVGCRVAWAALARDPFDYLDLATWYVARP